MSTLLLLTNALQASAEVLPSLALLHHQIRILPAEVSALVDAPDADAVLLDSAGPAEIEARLRLVTGRLAAVRNAEPETQLIRSGDVVIDEASYTAKLNGRALDLTYKEFELFKFLAQHPGRVFTREQLLQEVWGYDYFGGTRTVDVHVRRLRAKLGPEHESLIGTVRNVGYRFVIPPSNQRETADITV